MCIYIYIYIYIKLKINKQLTIFSTNHLFIVDFFEKINDFLCSLPPAAAHCPTLTDISLLNRYFDDFANISVDR